MKEQDKNRAKWIAASYVCKGGFDVYVFDKKCGLITMKRIEKGEIVMDTITAFYVQIKIACLNFPRRCDLFYRDEFKHKNEKNSSDI